MNITAFKSELDECGSSPIAVIETSDMLASSESCCGLAAKSNVFEYQVMSVCLSSVGGRKDLRWI
jgi:hypothetical protein